MLSSFAPAQPATRCRDAPPLVRARLPAAPPDEASPYVSPPSPPWRSSWWWHAVAVASATLHGAPRQAHLWSSAAGNKHGGGYAMHMGVDIGGKSLHAPRGQCQCRAKRWQVGLLDPQTMVASRSCHKRNARAPGCSLKSYEPLAWAVPKELSGWARLACAPNVGAHVGANGPTLMVVVMVIVVGIAVIVCRGQSGTNTQ